MNPITDLSTLNSISQLNTVYQFGSAAEVIEAAGQGDFYVVKNPNVTSGNNVVNFNQYVQQTEGLTGGAKVGSSTMDAAQGAGEVTVSAAGASVAVGVSEVVAGVAAGLGLGIIAYDVAPEFWTRISNAIFGTDIPYDDLEQYYIIGTLKDNICYFSQNIIDSIKKSLIDMGAFTTVDTISGVESTGTYILKSAPNPNNQILNVLTNSDDMASDIFQEAISNIGMIMNKVNSALGSFGTYNYFRCTSEYVRSDLGIIQFYVANATNRNSDKSTRISQVFSTADNGDMIYTCGIDCAKYQHGIIYFQILNSVFQISLSLDNIQENTTEVDYISKLYPYKSNGDPTFTSSCVDYSSVPSIEGVYTQEGATIPDESTPIPEEYPDWAQRIIEIGGFNSENEIVSTPYYPITIPNINPLTEPTNIPQEEAQQGNEPEKWTSGISNLITPIITDSPIDPSSKDSGNTPTVVVPPISSQGVSAALFTVYHPSQSQLRSLANVLWSSDLISQIKSIFQNPMDGVISLMSLFATPTDGSSGNIILGTIDSGVSAPIVTDQYIDIDCGSVQVPEIYGDATDYSPYVNITIFLPFIGMRKLNTNEVVAGNVSVKYRVDVLTGTCLASVNVVKDGSNATLYTFEGNCGIELPLTGADRSRLLSGVLSVAGTAVAAYTGAISAPVAGIGIAGGAASASHVGVDRSGSFSGNGGAMASKTPYLIVTRTVPYTASNYNELYGFPSNVKATLSNLSGYTRVKDVRTNNISNATDEEKMMIETLLKNGVYV